MKFIVLVSILLLIGCQSITTTYIFDDNGNIIKKIVSTCTDVKSIADKNRVTLRDSMDVKLSCTLTDSSTYLPTFDLSYHNGKSIYISTQDTNNLPAIVEAINTVSSFSLRPDKVDIIK